MTCSRPSGNTRTSLESLFRTRTTTVVLLHGRCLAGGDDPEFVGSLSVDYTKNVIGSSANQLEAIFAIVVAVFDFDESKWILAASNGDAKIHTMLLEVRGGLSWVPFVAV